MENVPDMSWRRKQAINAMILDRVRSAWGRHVDTNEWFQASPVICNGTTDTEPGTDTEKQRKLPEEAPEQVSSELVVQVRQQFL